MTPLDQLNSGLAALDAAAAAQAVQDDARLATAALKQTGSTASWLVTAAGKFTLTFGAQQTGNLVAADLTAAGLQTILRALSSIGSGNCTVTGNQAGPWTVLLSGTLALTDQPANALTGSPADGQSSCTVQELTPGVSPAGSQFNSQIATASANLTAGQAAYATGLATIDSDITAAGTAAALIPTAAPSNVTADIGTLQADSLEPISASGGGVTVSNAGPADCAAADVTAAINSAVGTAMTSVNQQVNAKLVEIQKIQADTVVALNAIVALITGGNLHTQTAVDQVIAVAQAFRNRENTTDTTEADKATARATLDALLP
jgi:hypothetical protein